MESHPPADPRRRRIRILFALAVAPLLAGGALGLRALAPAATPLPHDDFATVTRRSFPLEVTASGDLEAKNQTTLQTPKEASEYGRSTISEIVPEGTVAKKGDILCRLNTKELKEQAERLNLAVTNARAELAAAEQSLAMESETCANAEKNAAEKLAAAKADLELWVEGTDVQKSRDLARDIETSARDLAIAQREKANNQTLFDKRFISQSDLEKSDIALIKAREAHETAKLTRKIYDDFTRRKDRNEKEAAIRQAALEDAHARKQTAGKMIQLQSKLDGARETLRLNETALKTTRGAITACALAAPQDGIVIYADPHWGDSAPMGPGKAVYPGQPIILLPDTSHMMVNLRVHEAGIQKVQTGQEVAIQINARPGRAYVGRVVKKADTADSNRYNPFTAEYRVRVELPKDVDAELKPGMNCRGAIRIGEVKDTLTLPAQAVFADGDTRACWVDAGGGKVRRKTVEIADAGLLYAALTKGLAEGDRVLLRAPAPDEILKEP